ncbi:HAD family hydrolase [Nonomuraea jabiensis]|uniref:3-amino-5-hydroxybenzoic acid synthesis related protein n=1 Tax=Nonomuraea jabiensis TaxID=882448 RepID=A0A7W9L8W8_9ACTN|nr:HAD hydrolase-like protein [Nonomuraea jabiensis]MBB5774972.1 3-amino-5-hydroxybenzoic acid synthesis related protein [Nonomuraea jabiensis]
MTTAVLFDLDGTIIDSEPIATQAFRAAYVECGGLGEAPVDRFLAMAGRPFEEIVAELRLPPAIVGRFRSRSQEQAHKVQIFPGMWRVLTEAARRGARIGVITGKDRPRTEHVMSLLGLTSVCHDLVTPSDPPRPKPAPDGVWWLCERFDVAPRNAILIGDSCADIAAGNAAGVRTVACLWGAGRLDDLKAEGPDQFVSSPWQLDAMLRDLLEDPS